MRPQPVFLAFSLLPFATPLLAQEPASARGDEIIVTGTKTTKQAVAHYVDSITSPVDGQVARFRDAICPASFGFPAAYNGIIEQRLREDAVRVGLRVGSGRCDANVVLIVADDPIPLVKTLRRKRPQMFVGLEYSQIEDVLRTEGPVRTWQVEQPRGSDGRPLQRVMFAPNELPIGGNGAWLNPAAANSRIQQGTQVELVTTFVVISAQAVDGLTLTQVADYAAMRALASTRAPVDLTAPTILSLFNQAGAKPSELTAWDIAYLRGVYLTDNGLAARSQEASISGVVRRQLDKPANR